MIKPDTIIPCAELSDEGYKVVAVIGWVNDFAAYQFYPDVPDEVIAAEGDKIDLEQARRLFPELKDLKYRI